jgi:hypothetical protein
LREARRRYLGNSCALIMNTPSAPLWFVALRWIAFLPAAFVGAWVTWIVVSVLSRWSLGYAGVESGSFLDTVFQTTSAHAIMGGAFVVIGTKIAPPGQRRIVVYVLAGVAVLACGMLLVPAIMTRNWWSVIGAVFTALGAGGVLYAVHHDEGFRRDYFANDPELGLTRRAGDEG